jgi:hypothetical protein
VTCDASNEPLASQLNNFITSFYGSLTKTCVNNQVVWVLPCDLDSGIPGYPRIANEGLACYFIRVFTAIVEGAKVKVTDNDTTPGNLSDKIAAGNEITLTVLNPSGDEDLEVAYAIPAPVAISASDIDWSLSYTFYKTLAANTAFTFSNEQEGKVIVVAITNTAGNFTATWPAAVQWTLGIEPTLTLGAKRDVFTFVKINGIITGSVVQNTF